MVSLTNGKLCVSRNSILSDVQENIFLTPDKNNHGKFIGVLSDQKGSRLVFPVGKLRGLRILCLYRYHLWWMAQWMGTRGKDIPSETQFLMVEVTGDGEQVFYVVFLPIIEGDFRAVLQGNDCDELEICLESGDSSVQEFEGRQLVYVAAGKDPYRLVEDSVKSLQAHLQTFVHRDYKEKPDMLNWFGWCTWDAFYTDVSAKGVKEGIRSLQKGGTCPKFVIIDDGWQTVCMDSTGIESRYDSSANFANRLTDIKENNKFQKESIGGESDDGPKLGFREIITEIKDGFSLKYVYIWHAIVGYWGGIQPGVSEMEKYESKIVDAIPSRGVESNGVSFVLKSIMTNRVGLVNPDRIESFYNDLHCYLASIGVDGVKVDNQSILETLGEGFGGRVKLARKYHEALQKSTSKNFKNNEVISCMSHSTDALYNAKKINVIRASDDFFPRDPASHTIHIACVAYNTVFLGEFMQPDWDMFHSLHPMAEYHGAARAIGGCPVYVSSDKPGNHDFDVLKKLVLYDGSILRANLPGRPTTDCLFSDPTRDGNSLMKIWNMNEFTGVIGVFNCQGASWCRITTKNLIHEQPESISGVLRATDVHYLPSIVENGWSGDCIMYSHRARKLVYVPEHKIVPIQLKIREYEIYTVVPVKKLTNGASFAPIGLVNMYNSGGAIKELNFELNKAGFVEMRIRGCGIFGAYSSVRPKRIVVDTEEEEFVYEVDSGLVTLGLRIPEKELYAWSIAVEI